MAARPFRIRKEAPPENPRPKVDPGRIDREVERMKLEPGEWFKVREKAAAGAQRVYQQRGCETRTVSVGEGRHDIYAMYPEAEPTITKVGNRTIISHED